MKLFSSVIIAFLFFQFTSLAQSGWVQQTSGTTEDLYAVFFINEDVGWAVGDGGTIVHTTDGGDNWDSQVSNTTEDLYYIKFMDEDNGWALGEDILKTTDGGDNWNSLNAPTGGYYFLDYYNGFMALESGDTYFLKTIDGGLSWDTFYNFNYCWYDFRLYFVNENIGFVQGIYCGINPPTKTKWTSDGGYSWEDLDLPGYQTSESYCFVNDSIGWVGIYGHNSAGGVILKTEDSGENWSEKLITDIGVRCVFFVNKNKGWALGGVFGDSIICSTDGGETWSTQSIGTSMRMNSSYFVNENIGWLVGESGTVLYTTTGGVVSVEENKLNGVITDYSLTQNFPNPFNPSTKIKYSVPQLSNVTIKVFDILGNELETLVNHEKPSGTYEITWYAENLPSGIYFYQLNADNYFETKKMVLMK